MATIKQLIAGYKRFYQTHFVKDKALYKSLWSNGQSPKTLVIACSDSRSDPSILTAAQPGDLFVIRNVANLIPPYQPDKGSFHGVSAALEFAICNLKVANVIVLGHSGCAGIHALGHDEPNPDRFSFIYPWVNIAADAKKEVCLHGACLTGEEKDRHLEKASILISMRNLLTFPWVKDLHDQGKLNIHGWYFSMQDGALESYNPETKKFARI